jgi:hypothetical protein
VCMGLGLALGHVSKLRLASCFGGIFGQRLWNLSAAVVLQIFCSSSLMVRNHQNQCSVLALGNCIDYCRSELLGLHLVLPLSTAARACGNAEPQIC